jgi:23S rRNA pseudouridine2605 synthase
VIRLNKYISNSGLCTRREADAYIVDGRVKVDKKIVKTLGYKVSFNAEVRVDNQIIVPYLYSYIVLNKPIDFKLKGENNIYNLLSSSKIDNLIITEKNIDDLKGLVVFSNDIEFNKNFRTFLTKINQLFHVKFKTPISLENLDFLRKNKSKNLKIISVNFVNNTSKNEIGLEIISDNYLNVVGLLKSLKNEIISIDRVLIDNISKKKLSRGWWRFLTDKELSNFKSI